MPRGGARKGRQGVSYTNRGDLNTQPIRTGPASVYGEATRQREAQQVAPLPQVPPVGAGAAGLMPMMEPGAGPDFMAPTDNPNEPLTTGIASGPGMGPEALQRPDPMVNGAAVLNALGKDADPDTARLRDLVNAMLANQAAP